MSTEKQPQYNWVARLTGFFLRNTQIAIVLFLVIVVSGLVSLLSLQREGFPQVPVKVAVIQTVYKGAAPAEIERSVTNPIETALKGNNNIKELSSQSRDSASVITATIEPSADLDSAIQEINGKVAAVQLPNDAEKPSVFQPATGGAAFTYGLTGGSTLDLLKQGRIFEQEMSQVKGVKEVKADVNAEAEVEVTFDTVKLVANGVDISKISDTVAASNVNIPAGQVTAGSVNSTVIMAGRLESLEQLQEVRLPTAGGGVVRLGDVATVSQRVNKDDQLTRFGYQKEGKPVGVEGLTYSIQLRDDADILQVDGELQKAVERLKQDKIIAENVEVVRLYDQAESTRQQIHEIVAGAFGEHWENIGWFGLAGFLFGGIWLLAIAMAVFVNVRAALVAAISVPLSFFVTVTTLYVGGVTLNTLTLFSMILVLGLVVDPVIVVLEALQRYKDRGYQGIEAAMRAVDSVGLGVLMAVLISTIVFIPFGIVSGVFGEIIRFIPITVIPALVASFFVPILFLTAIGNRVLKSHHKDGEDTSEEASLWRVSLWFQRTNRSILKRWPLQVAIIAVAAVLPIAIAGFLFGTGRIESVQFSKPDDTEALTVTVSYPAARSTASVEQLAQKTEQALSDHGEIRSYLYQQQSPGSFTILANLTPPSERERKSTEIVDDIRGELPSEPGQVYASAETLGSGTPVPEFPVQLQVYDNDQKKLKDFSVAAGEYLRGVEGVKRVSDGYTDGDPAQITVTPNIASLAAVGLTPASFGGQIAGVIGEQDLTKLQLDSGEVAVMGHYSNGAKPATESDIAALTVSTPSGPVAVGSVATVTSAPGIGSINHFNGNRFATVKAQLNEGVDQFAVQEKLNTWAKDNRERFGLLEDAFESKGEGDEIVKSFQELFVALGAAILLTYVVLALFFRSFLQPLIITFAVPLSFIGVFPALYWFGGGQFGFLEILGMITLVGIVENVGIFVIDYANRRVKEGMDHRDAIALATAVRFRPIFLTKVCALGSLLPLAIISPFWRGLAAVIVAGILTSGITSLFTTPILYHWVESFTAWRHRFGSRISARWRRRNA
ncbi:efflux RND transporter permease subunit [Patescibacteria group bacterium]|nr:MAG: efflux RND transporter permease subunit [Patescibacteria group bacterium]